MDRGPDPAPGRQNKACRGGCAGRTSGRCRHGEHSDEVGGTTDSQQKVMCAVLEAKLKTQMGAGWLSLRPHPLAGPRSSQGVPLQSVSRPPPCKDTGPPGQGPW